MGDDLDAISREYLGFAKHEAKGTSQIYERMALEVSRSEVIQTFLARLPPEKRQPNLLFAAVRYLHGVPDPDELESIVRERQADLASVMRERRTQTNEPGRCAVLLPVLSAIDQAVALVEVGASAGLCLLPDKYSYTYVKGTTETEILAKGNAPNFRCEVNAEIDVPEGHPNVVWRAGLDINPLNAAAEDDVRWLRALAWPEHQERQTRLDLALQIAAEFEGLLVKAGDLRSDLFDLLSSSPTDATTVVFHTAVLSYVKNEAERERFREDVLKSGAVWISNEVPKIFANTRVHSHRKPPGLHFLLCVDGAPRYWTSPYGDRITGWKPSDEGEMRARPNT